MLALVFLALVVIVVLAGKLPVAILAIYLGLRVLTFAVYAMDKSAARQDSRQTPKNTLQVLALAGGWPDAQVAQHTLRHNSIKQTFRLVFQITPGGGASSTDCVQRGLPTNLKP